MKKRFLLILTAVLLLTSLLTSCFNNDTDPDGEPHVPQDNGGGSVTDVPAIIGKTPETDASGVVYTNYGSYYSVTGFKPVSSDPVELVIPASFNGLPVTSIGMRAFAPDAVDDNTVITKITVSEGITRIYASAFAECVNVTQIILPSTVTSIDKNAFARCKSLASINIPASVTEIGDSIFEDCEALEEITVASENPNFASKNGDLYSKDMKTLIRYAPAKSATTYTVEAGVTTIASGCFQATKLTEVTLSAEICRIEPTAFINCDKLTKVTVPTASTANWWYSSYESATFGVNINQDNVKNPATFATNLKNTYLRSYVARIV